MWMCTPASNPAIAQAGMLMGSLADMCAELPTDMSTLPHENTHTASPAVTLTLRHIAYAHMTARQQVHLRACPNCKLSHNTTSKQESMHT
jgi:hypothetical protein